MASVKVVSSQWTEPFLDEVDPVDGEGYPIPTGADQLKTLPWININEVLVEFTESMNIVAADISLHGVSVANYERRSTTTPLPYGQHTTDRRQLHRRRQARPAH